MKQRSRLLGALALLLTVSFGLVGCGANQGATTELVDGIPNGVCSDRPEFDEPFALSCVQAVRLAEARLGWLHWPITATDFHRGGPCPPNARCFIAPTHGTVIFHFTIGDPVLIRIAPDAQGVPATGDPEPVPAWMLEELQANR